MGYGWCNRLALTNSTSENLATMPRLVIIAYSGIADIVRLVRRTYSTSALYWPYSTYSTVALAVRTVQRPGTVLYVLIATLVIIKA